LNIMFRKTNNSQKRMFMEIVKGSESFVTERPSIIYLASTVEEGNMRVGDLRICGIFR